jgi:hypothetical protein
MKDSSAIKVTWDKGLVVTFLKSGKTYRYTDAKSVEYATLCSIKHKSIGAYFNDRFVRTKRPFERVDAPTPRLVVCGPHAALQAAFMEMTASA